MRRPSEAVRLLIVANFLVYGIEVLLGEEFLRRYALWPAGRAAVGFDGDVGQFELWQLVTYSFLHANGMHLALNMFGLYMFGRDVANSLGAGAFLRLYFAAVLCAGLTQLFVVSSISTAEVAATVGASGGVFGVLLAFGMLFPDRPVMLLFPPIPMRARTMVILYAIVEMTAGVLGTASGIAHFAHLGGMIGAYLLLRRWVGRGPAD